MDGLSCNAKLIIGLQILILGSTELQIRQNGDFPSVRGNNLSVIIREIRA